LAAPSRD